MVTEEKSMHDVPAGSALQQDPRELVVVAEGDSLSTVFALLQKHNSLIAPVYSAAEKKWIGFIDVVDVLTTILSSPEDDGADENDDAPVSGYTARDAINRSKRHPFVSIKESDTMYQAAKTMVERKVHYLAVFGGPNSTKLLNVLDGWQILSYVFHKLPAPLRNPKVADFGNMEPVLTVNSNVTAIQAFNTLIEKNAEFAAVVDENTGKLVDSISGFDSKLLYIHESTWLDLQDTVLHYLRKSADTVEATVTTTKEKKVLLQTLMNSNCVYASTLASWADVCTAMVDNELMHLYIAEDEDMHPKGSIGLREMLGALL
ncbi:5'-AMP-activated protein kinase subunit gamma-3 [Porphyridium purpureum]|uniref:5'-AMP-activated protein kinase subunit gamma-3 n=1 Tax=Porphyridium purpureum TaxID=35688 RepID=A0A5J4Z1J3_PORPP|nr:5'-AMP-activated protein kinase subunit gamma-3 [Porphyridium purpureum]|eukprot:POR8362..scf208_2